MANKKKGLVLLGLAAAGVALASKSSNTTQSANVSEPVPFNPNPVGGGSNINLEGLKSIILNDETSVQLLKGQKGDKGDTGNAGAKGDKGDTGNAGAKGDKGDTGNAGAKGDKGDTGDSIIVRTDDPTDLVSSKVGDLYLNTTSGTMYQRSGLTQSQFIVAGLQGIVLPNSIWINKGNLKGAAGKDATLGNFLRPSGTYIIDKNDSILISIVNGSNPQSSTVNNLTLPSITDADKFVCTIVVVNPTGCNLILPTGTFPMVQPWGATTNVAYKFVDANGNIVADTTKFFAQGSKITVCAIYDFANHLLFYTY